MIKYQDGGFTQTYGENPYTQDTQDTYLRKQLENLGVQGLDPYRSLQGQISELDPETIERLIRQKFDFGEKYETSPEMFQGITSGDFKALGSDFYAPMFEEGKTDPLSALLQGYTSGGGGGGGMFSTGGRRKSRQKARDIYKRGVEDVKIDIGELQSEQYGSILEKLSGALETGIDIRYGT
jgi:hypothetical protein